MLALMLIIRLICAVGAAAIAAHKGRSVVAWFFGGLLIELIAVIIVACLPNLKEQKAYRQRTESERRRLREQLRQERMKNEAFRRYSLGRLDAHDHQLGVDTRSQQALPSSSEEASLRHLASGGASLNPDSAQWYYEANGEAMGPVWALEVKRMLETGAIGGNTLLWSEGLAEWTPASQIPAFRSGGNP
jgi:hypothetical protein